MANATEVLNTFTRFCIILTNSVKFVTNVESYDRLIRNHLGVQDWEHFVG